MRKTLLFTMTALLLASAAFAGDHYRFHVRITDARSGLASNPDAAVNVAPEQMSQAVLSRVFVLDHTTGLQWKWLMLNSELRGKKVEEGFNEHGSASPKKDADLVLSAGDQDAIKLRCLRDRCSVTNAGKTVELKKGESATIAADSDVEVSFAKQ